MSIVRRMFRAARLDVNLYEEVEADTTATGQAVVVVVLGALATGISSIATIGPWGLLLGAIGALIAWAVWAWLNYMLGSKLFREPQTRADWGQLARTMGFASTPQIAGVLAVIPVPPLQFTIVLAVGIWTWVAMVVAVRQALDYNSTLRAVTVTLLGFVVVLGLRWILAAFI